MHNITFLEPQLQSKYDYVGKLSNLQTAEALLYYCIREEYYKSQLHPDY